MTRATTKRVLKDLTPKTNAVPRDFEGQPLADTFTTTSALKKVKDPNLMLAQNQLLRAHALGSFADILKPEDAEAIHDYLIARANEDWGRN